MKQPTKKNTDVRKVSLIRSLRLGGLQKSLIVILAVVLVILVNNLLSTIPLRLDASYGKAYTLSLASKKIIQSLKNPVKITFFLSSDIPTKFIPLKSDVLALLDEYKRQSNKINLTIVDPKKDEKSATSAKDFSIPELQLSQLDQDKYALSTAYFGIGLSQGDKRESIPQVTDIGSLEYNMTSSIYKLTRKDVPVIGFIDQGELIGQDQFQTLKQALGRQYEVTSVMSATDSAQLSKTYKTILIADDNSKNYTDEEITALKQYIKSGGNVILFLDGVWINTQVDFNQAVTEAKHNLFNFTKQFGITLNKDLALSASSEIVNFGSSSGPYISQYPFWVHSQSFNKNSSYFTNVTQLTYPWVSSLDLKNISGLQVTPLVYSSKQSWSEEKNISINPQSITTPKPSDLKTFTVTAESRLKKGGKLLVIPSSRFAQDSYLSRSSNNLELIVNVLNDYVSGGALSGIQSRTVNIYPLPDLPASQKDIFRYLNMLLLPALFGIYGAWRLIRRR